MVRASGFGKTDQGTTLEVLRPLLRTTRQGLQEVRLGFEKKEQ